MRAPLLAGVLVLVCLVVAAQPLPGVPPSSAPASSAATSAGVAATPKHNFVVIFLDDMRADELVAMPYTSRMIGARGATFDHAYAPYPLCCPARATILSGQYPHNNHVFGNLPPTGGVTAFDARRTIGTWLKRHGGYRTAYVGKYLNRYGQDTRRRHRPPGWTTWNALVRRWYNYRGFAMNLDRYVVRYTDEYQSDVLGELSTDFITDDSGPFLLVTAFLAPHSGGPPEPDDTRGALDGCFATDLCGNTTPAVPEKYRNAEAGHRLPSGAAYDEADVSDKPAHIRALPSFRRGHAVAHQELWEQRLEAIRSVDDQVRSIVRTLRQTGMLRRTYVLVTSDNGFLLGEHRIPFGKVHPYEPSARVPMLLRGPGIPAGTHVEQLVGLHDVAPTVLHATGHQGVPKDELDGVNLLRLVADPRAHAGRDIVLEAGPTDGPSDAGSVRDSSPGARAYRGIRTDSGWKYIEYATGQVELYDLNTDPDELTNLAEDPAYARRMAELQRATERLSRCVGHGCVVDAVR